MTWKYESASTQLYLSIAVTLIIGFGLFFALMRTPPRFRSKIAAAFTFLAGLLYVGIWLWPRAQAREPNELPANTTEAVAFWLQDTQGQFQELSNILTAFLLLMGVFSLLRLHVNRVRKQQTDWPFSIVLLVSVGLMTFFGYWDWRTTMNMTPEQLEAIKDVANQPTAVWMKDLLFQGLLQTMEAAMFSIIAFYILSAAYRAFRVRSVEATILLASALIVMLQLLGMAENYWSVAIDNMGGLDNPNSFINNLRLESLTQFIRDNLQAPGLRAIDFGVGVGVLAMALRLWLSLERGGTAN